MKVSFDGFGERVATFYSDVAARGPVKLGGDRTVTACEAGDRFIGVALAADELCAAVQTEGFVRVACTGTLPGVGFARLVADGAGGVMAGDGGSEYRIVESGDGAVGFIL